MGSPRPMLRAPAPPDWAVIAENAAWTVPFILLAALFAVLRSSLLHSSAARVLARVKSDARKRRIEPLLARADTLATSAGILEVTLDVAFATQVLRFAQSFTDLSRQLTVIAPTVARWSAIVNATTFIAS